MAIRMGFYKGIGTILRAHGKPLEIPPHADDSGDEAEIAGCYIVADDGTPFRIGLVQGNEFSDHVLEHHHFKHTAHRTPGDAHVHFFGADLFSFNDRIRLQDGDEMIIAFDGFGRPLRNLIQIARESQPFVEVRSL